MRFATVCSGIGAPECAWKALGWDCAWQSEIEAFPSAVLAHHYPGVPNLGDMTQITKEQIESHGAIDVLCGGTPCQSFSVAGLRKGLADPRGNLALEFLRITDLARPKWVVWENVPGVLSSSNGRDFGAFLGALGKCGYGFAYRVLDAQYFGVPQRRRRVFVVGCAGDWRGAAAVLFERESLCGNPAPRRGTGKNAPTIPSRRSAGGGLGTDFDCDGGLIAASTSGNGSWREGAGPLRAREQDSHENIVVGALAANAGPRSHDAGNFHCNQAVDAGHILAFGGNNQTSPIEVATACRAKGGTGHGDFESETFVAFSVKDHGADAGNIAPTVRAGAHSQSHANGGAPPAVAFDMRGRNGGAQMEGPHYTANIRASSGGSSRSFVAGMAVRRLTPRECERLQGLPDDYTLIPVKVVKRERLYSARPWSYVEISGVVWQLAADGPRYKAIGNSMAVPVLRWIGQRIKQTEGVA